ncbi:transporter substrate-binding domain-containing protein [Pseudoalteromonas sp. JBTF-M23]|uniref:Transporter substrate-binding domain-containing protein n=1 Tax=Pseudoalteromonas caenipelagi TaxID=2726988 RepID=A0A849V7J1_9GAMM|nr:transporter substrate-binding domain-containing protein [Pseudoalteromonas caenipelagi]NOU49302.1 transporter substrate-binding domain-containing protein [Pseudoalteromonas caenipelagi]
MKSLIWALLGIASISNSVSAQGKIDIYTEHFPPYQYQGNGGEIDGHATMMVRALMVRTNFDYQIYMLPWHRAKQQFEASPSALIYSIARTAKRERHYHWLMPLCDLKVGFYKRVDNEQWHTQFSLDSIKNYVVGVGVAQPSLQYLESHGFKKSRLVTLSSLNQAGGLLEKGRIDFLFGAQSFVEQMSEAMGTQGKWKLVLEVPELTARLYLAAHVDAPSKMLTRLASAATEINQLNTASACHSKMHFQ